MRILLRYAVCLMNQSLREYEKQPLETDTIIKRINGIQAEIAELQKLGIQSLDEFSSGYGYQLAEHHLHHALEGVFHITSHILSRIPGGQATEYAESARKFGEFSLIDREFAATTLVKMAKYRNRIVHFYAQNYSRGILRHHQKQSRRF